MTTDAMPLRLGTVEEFQTVRELLQQAGYTERAICDRLGIAAFTNFGKVRPGARLTEGLETPLDALIRLFLECEPAARTEVEPLLGRAGLTALLELGLLITDPIDSASLMAPVGVCPTRGLYFASDRGGELGKLSHDVVYPPMLENTQNFLDVFPRTPCDAFLDLGAGTGVAALMAADRFAKEAWACDITERSVYFSEFNRRLNALDNVTVARGDLYEAVGDRRFDRIVTHPPYVPVSASNPTYIFRDGGDDGEQIIRRAIEGLPRHLAPGGRFYSLVLVSDREGETAESRIRSWLGERESEFDIAMIAETAREPFDFLGRAMQKGTHRPEDLQYWSGMYRSLKVKYLVYGAIVVQRHDEERPAFTVRLQKGPRSGIAEAEWALGWHTEAASPGSTARFLASRPSLSPELNLAVLHRIRDGSLVPEEFMLRINYPFEVECKCPAWTVALIRECDGQRTSEEILNILKAEDVVDPDTEADEFVDILKVLGGSGFLEFEQLPVLAVPVPTA